MFGKKKSRSERSFSMMLAEEILRAELKKLYGDHIKFFQCDIVAAPTTDVNSAGATMTCLERKFPGATKERYVEIEAVIGPFGRVYPENPLEDKRRDAYRVKAGCRLFSIEGGCTFWRPHFLSFWVELDSGLMSDVQVRYYEAGIVKKEGGWWSHEKTHENPCQDMCESQIQPQHPKVSASNWGHD